MINVFNRVKLYADSSAEAAANIWGRLKAEGIPYTMKTQQSRGALGKAVTSGVGVGRYMGGMAASSFSDQVTYVYTIYVRRADEERARALCDLPARD